MIFCLLLWLVLGCADQKTAVIVDDNEVIETIAKEDSLNLTESKKHICVYKNYNTDSTKLKFDLTEFGLDSGVEIFNRINLIQIIDSIALDITKDDISQLISFSSNRVKINLLRKKNQNDVWNNTLSLNDAVNETVILTAIESASCEYNNITLVGMINDSLLITNDGMENMQIWDIRKMELVVKGKSSKYNPQEHFRL